LKSSAARAVMKKRATRAPTGKKEKIKQLSDYFQSNNPGLDTKKSEEEARKMLHYLKEKQAKIVKEKLFYEKNQDA